MSASSMPVCPWNSAEWPLTIRAGPRRNSSRSRSWIECSSRVPGTDLVDLGSPRRVVHALDRDELVVAEHDAHHPPTLGVVDHALQHQERGRVAQHETYLIGHARGSHRLDHPARVVQIGGQRFLAEHREPSRRHRVHQARMFRGPRAHVHRVDGVEQLVDRGRHLGATGRGEGLRLARVGIVHGDDRGVGIGGVQHLAVVRGDEAAADEADSCGHGDTLGCLRPALGVEGNRAEVQSGSTTSAISSARCAR